VARAAIVSGVDKSRIQSYQIREFVEALAGLEALAAAERLGRGLTIGAAVLR
jgi:hypothetical protein